jgi:hypothetical protein
MKLKDFFAQLKTQGKISHEEYDKFLESDLQEIPDAAVKAFEERFMTPERASTHPEVVWKLKAQALNPLDNDIKKMLETVEGIDKYTAMEIAKHVRQTKEGDVADTYKQFQALTAALPKLIDKVKVAPNDEEAKAKLTAQKKLIDDLTEKFSGVEKEKEDWKKNIETEYGKREKNYRVDGLLEKMVNSYTFAEAYEQNRPLLTKALLGEIKSSNLFDIAKKNEDDVLEVYELKDGVMSPKFNGNTPVTVQSLLDEKFKPLLKQNGVESEKQMTTHQFRVNDTPKTTRQGAPVSVAI